MMNKKGIDVLKQLRQYTIEGKLEWEETEQENQYRVDFPGASVEIEKGTRAKYRDRKFPSAVIIIRFFNSNGQLVDEFDEFDFLDFEFTHSKSLLAEIYGMARHTAMHADQMMDHILNFFDEIDEDVERG